MISSLLGLASSLSWGIGDFTGGLAARKLGAYRVVMVTLSLGLIFILLTFPFFDEPIPDGHAIKWSAAAGFSGTVGLITMYEAMRRGPLSVVAPLAALLGAIVPVIAGVFVDGLP